MGGGLPAPASCTGGGCTAGGAEDCAGADACEDEAEDVPPVEGLGLAGLDEVEELDGVDEVDKVAAGAAEVAEPSGCAEGCASVAAGVALESAGGVFVAVCTVPAVEAAFWPACIA